MEYMFLTASHQTQLRRERLLELEADHERVVLALEESPGNRRAIEDLAELTRRIGHHLGRLPQPPDTEPGAATPDSEETPGRKAVDGEAVT